MHTEITSEPCTRLKRRNVVDIGGSLRGDSMFLTTKSAPSEVITVQVKLLAAHLVIVAAANHVDIGFGDGWWR